MRGVIKGKGRSEEAVARNSEEEATGPCEGPCPGQAVEGGRGKYA